MPTVATPKAKRVANRRLAGARGYTRRPLAVGNIYRFRGYAKNGFKVVGMSLPGTPSDDGGLPGVAVQWLNRAGERGWYPFRSETEFWSYPYFANAEDPEAYGHNEKLTCSGPSVGASPQNEVGGKT